MNIRQAISKTDFKLLGEAKEDYRPEAEFCLSFVLKKPREFLFAHPEKKLSFWQSRRYKNLINRIIKNIPLAYLFKEKEFYGLSFFVNKNVLIPRPETELMVEEVLNAIKNCSSEAGLFLMDVGTGSGCIIITLAKILKKEFRGIDFNFFGLDISAKALKVARKNAKTHGVCSDVGFVKSDLLEGFAHKRKKMEGLTMITANLPYLTKEQIKNSPTIQKEPLLALNGGIGGLDCYCRFFAQIKKDRCFFRGDLLVFCEIDSSQKDKIEILAKKYFPEAVIEFKKDLGGRRRLVKIEC